MLQTTLRLLVVQLLVVPSLCGIGAASDVSIELHSTQPVAAGTPISLPLPTGIDASRPVEIIVEETGKQLPAQIDHVNPPRIWWIVADDLPADKKHRHIVRNVAPSDAPPAVTISDTKDNIQVRVTGKPVLQYNKNSPRQWPKSLGLERTGYIHPVYTPAGQVITDDFAPSHAHQHGIMFAWRYARFRGRRLNFWETQAESGTIRHVDVLRKKDGDVFGLVAVRLEHVDVTGPDAEVPVLEETLSIRVFNRTDAFVFDVDSVQRCIQEDPLLIDEYHYGGLMIRGHRDWQEQNSGFLTSAGKTRTDGNHTRCNWCDIHGPIDGTSSGITVFSHPSNFRTPEPVRLHPSMPYFCYCPAILGDFSIEPGESHRYRYRFLVHSQDWSAESADRFFANYAEPPVAITSRPAWTRHTIDDSAAGADGVRLADINGDGLLDIATGWEEASLVRAYLHPGFGLVKQTWPHVTVGNVKSPEDALFADLDSDGRQDVVSCCEGETRNVFVHWAPTDDSRQVDPRAWKTEAFPLATLDQMWMQAWPMEVDRRHGIDLVVGSKGANGSIGWLESPSDPRNVRDWRFHRLRDACWTMSLQPHDMDDDGLLDIVLSDRRGNRSGVYWLENPGPEESLSGQSWREHLIGAQGEEVMFLDVADISGDGLDDVAAAIKPYEVGMFVRSTDPSASWREYRVCLGKELVGTAKAVRVGDIDLDGETDIVFSCEQAKSPRSGVVWIKLSSTLLAAAQNIASGDNGHDVQDVDNEDRSVSDHHIEIHDISGPGGVKFDHVQLIDLDADGDLDVLTCEEADGLGVCWYENPVR